MDLDLSSWEKHLSQNDVAVSKYLVGGAKLIEDTVAANLDQPIEQAVVALVSALGDGKSVLLCGNGGSAADAMHIAGELVGRYLLNRRAYKVLALGTDAAVSTAWSNDFEFGSVFARQIEGLGEAGGVLWVLSTSGNSENIIRALATAKAKKMKTIAFTGKGGGRAAVADIVIPVPSEETPRIQEIHTLLYHYVCGEVERRLS